MSLVLTLPNAAAGVGKYPFRCHLVCAVAQTSIHRNHDGKARGTLRTCGYVGLKISRRNRDGKNQGALRMRLLLHGQVR